MLKLLSKELRNLYNLTIVSHLFNEYQFGISVDE